jgi:hypothetical protein
MVVLNVVVSVGSWQSACVSSHMWRVTLHTLSAVAHTTHNHDRHGSQLFRCCLNRKMLDMPELSSATSVRANISKNNIRDWEVVVLVQPSPVPVELRRVSLRLTTYACFFSPNYCTNL